MAREQRLGILFAPWVDKLPKTLKIYAKTWWLVC